jgi:phospholipid transport system substrate-binding protein
MTKLRPFVLALVLMTTVSMGAVAQQTRDDNSEKFIASLGHRALQVLVVGSQDPSTRGTAFRGILDEGFDLRLIGRYALGRYWRLATPEQRSEYVKLFEDFIVMTYVARLGEYSGESLRVVSSRPDDQDTIVTSEIVMEGRPSIRVDWRVRKDDSDGSETKIIDVIVEGISMLLTQRDEFASVIQRSGGNVEGLLTRLRDKSSDK